MYSLDAWARPLDHPKKFLVLSFITWKLILLCIALTSPGPGYDTSTILLHSNLGLARAKSGSGWEPASRLRRLVRWDAIYFTQLARRGYLWEQEWAFGWGFSSLVAVTSKALGVNGRLLLSEPEALAAIILAHVFHLMSVLVLYELTLTVCVRSAKARVSSFGVLTASLHIISPAGIFLSAPYAESSFSFLNFAGFYFYAKAMLKHGDGRGDQRDLLVLLSGIVFGIATTFRGNGLLSGLLIVWDVLSCAIRILRSIDLVSNTRHLLILSMSGLLLACIATTPQYLAYCEYCVGRSADNDKRPWCSHWPPSIYTWVQRHYWEVGFLKYWTTSNLPLFLLATPMLYIQLRSGTWALQGRPNTETSVNEGNQENIGVSPRLRIDRTIAGAFAIPQIALAVLALTSYHVQIITRLSSGYPVWYWWVASLALENEKISWKGREWGTAMVISRWMIIYAIVQGGLFASFLPPA